MILFNLLFTLLLAVQPPPSSFTDPGVILVADFPQRKKMPDSLRIQYEALAGEFNPNGVFPQIVVLDPSKKLLATLPYTEQSVQQFIGELRNL